MLNIVAWSPIFLLQDLLSSIQGFKSAVENNQSADPQAEALSFVEDMAKWVGTVCLAFVLDLEKGSLGLYANMLEDLLLILQETVVVGRHVEVLHRL